MSLSLPCQAPALTYASQQGHLYATTCPGSSSLVFSIVCIGQSVARWLQLGYVTCEGTYGTRGPRRPLPWHAIKIVLQASNEIDI